MGGPKYAAGFHFVVSTAEKPPDKQQRRAIRSHATRAQKKGRKPVQLPSWINPDHRLGSMKKSAKFPGRPESPVRSVPGPRRVGGDFSALQLPPGVEPFMIQDLVRLIDIDKQGAYPYEVCLHTHPVERGWFPYLMSDICCIHSMMFSLRAFVDPGPSSRLAAFHLAQTLHLLQGRLHEFGLGQRDSALSDSTIMAIVFLVMSSEFAGDFATAEKHLDGVIKIISLKGGLKCLSTHNNMQVKVCRADIGLALRSGRQPRLFQDGITWDCFLSGRGIIHCGHEPHSAQVHAFVATLDHKLGNCWKDLHAFSCMSRVAYQTTQKLSPETYNEMMVSIFYRLIHLPFNRDAVSEAVRAGMLAFCVTIFLMPRDREQPHERLLGSFTNSAFELLRRPERASLPPVVLLWLIIMLHLVAAEEAAAADWGGIWRGDSIPLMPVDWDEALGMLKSVMWVDFVHDVPGRRAFEQLHDA